MTVLSDTSIDHMIEIAYGQIITFLYISEN